MGDSDKLGGHECENWEIRVKTPIPGLEGLGAGGLDTMGDNMKLSPRVSSDREEERGETINMDECWTINIKVETKYIQLNNNGTGNYPVTQMFLFLTILTIIQAPATLNINTGDPDAEGFAVILYFIDKP